MANKAYHYMIYIRRYGDTTTGDIKNAMSLALDWYQIDDYLWVIYSTSDVEKLYTRLEPYKKIGEGNILILKLDPKYRQGWMSKSFWSWVRREDKDVV